jgi:hypothetical protein
VEGDVVGGLRDGQQMSELFGAEDLEWAPLRGAVDPQAGVVDQPPLGAGLKERAVRFSLAKEGASAQGRMDRDSRECWQPELCDPVGSGSARVPFCGRYLGPAA